MPQGHHELTNRLEAGGSPSSRCTPVSETGAVEGIMISGGTHAKASENDRADACRISSPIIDLR